MKTKTCTHLKLAIVGLIVIIIFLLGVIAIQSIISGDNIELFHFTVEFSEWLASENNMTYEEATNSFLRYKVEELLE